MKNIQIIDRASNATFSVFQSTEQEFEVIFPAGRDMELIEDLIARVGDDEPASFPLWGRPILKRDAIGIHGTLFYDNADRILPATQREAARDECAINLAHRDLFRRHRE